MGRTNRLRLADAEEAARLGMGADVPPLDLRLSLGAGDFAEVLAVVEDDGWGPGVERVPVRIAGAREPGRYVGELPDGSMLAVSAEHIADVAPAPQMGGFLDWFLKKREPGGPSMFSAFGQQPPETRLPALPAPPPPPPPSAMIPAPEPPKGLVARFLEFVRPTGERPSIFQAFRTPPPGPAGLPVERPETPIAPYVERPSMFAPFAPGARTMEEVRPQAFEFAEPTRPGPLVPIVEEAKELFQAVQPSAPPAPYEERMAKQAELWTGMFEQPGAERPVAEMFRPFQPSEILPEERARQDIPIPEEVRVRNPKVFALPARSDVIPSVDDLARGILTYFAPIEDLWQSIREARNSPRWQQEVAETGVGKEIYETLGIGQGRPNALEEFASYFHIPWEEMRGRAGIDIQRYQGEEYEVWVDTSRIIEEIILPVIENLQQAFDLLKPPDIPGIMTLEWSADGLQLALVYTEGEYRPGYEEPRPEAPRGSEAVYPTRREKGPEEPPGPGQKKKKKRNR